MVIPPFAPRLEKESSNAFRTSQQAKPGVNGGKGTGGAAGRVHWSAAQTLAPEGGEAPWRCIAQRLHLGCPGEQQRVGHNTMQFLRLQAVRITGQDSGG